MMQAGPKNHLSQQADPSAGWAQQAPLFSWAFLLGVQQGPWSAGVEQQPADASTGLAFGSLFF